ncbi:cob(I)yrinic acid a,c-diamide adenosyltransferase [Pseudactinotalea suaedae]|uniref:cob(I)yrinic acid a,c-diamide adenosyltransferase n=1 Tax=Pseudactinotalea suaedae TaxID=1524924 RepID=UPI0012E1D872|nr:cob(I)yrinic acid a,c-diamide adenosyltransferase [Pseudactinotalea suaedae]
MASSIYTRTGDDGTTGLFHGGRVSKADAIVDAYGAVDELTAVLGVARAGCPDAALAADLLALQRELFVLGADLATHPERRSKLEDGVSRVSPAMVAALEARIDAELVVRPLRPVFLVPGSNPTEAALDLARTVARRAERLAVAAADGGAHVSQDARHYLNRLSDLLFVLGRRAAGEEEPASRA